MDLVKSTTTDECEAIRTVLSCPDMGITVDGVTVSRYRLGGSTPQFGAEITVNGDTVTLPPGILPRLITLLQVIAEVR